MSPPNATGYAILTPDGTIHPQTVGHSPRSAIVNWLVMVYLVIVPRDATDADILTAWEQSKAHGPAEVVKISCTSEAVVDVFTTGLDG